MDAGLELDAQVVASLTDFISAEGVREVIDIYVEDAPIRLAEFRRGLEGGDLVLARRAAHTLKSTAAYLGAQRFSALCGELETAAGADDAGALRARLPELEARLAQVLKELGEVRAGVAP